jgi:RHS repeat-associated protein
MLAAYIAAATLFQNTLRSEGLAIWPIHPTHEMPVAAPVSRALTFSAEPTDREFLQVGLFNQTLVPVGQTASADNRAFAKALLAYNALVLHGHAPDELAPLTEFLRQHPNSAWQPALILNIGTIYRQTGHFSKAMVAFQEAWAATKMLGGANERAIGDAAIAELTQFNAYLGRKDVLATLLAETKGRVLHGTAAEQINDSTLGLAHMIQSPERSFRCGALALERIIAFVDPNGSATAIKKLSQANSSPNGLSLSAVLKMAAVAGMHYQMAFRTPGAPIVTPAVAHWKMGHYAAIVGKSEDRYLVQDGTFGQDIRVSATTLNEESSGYFLIPAGHLPQGWRPVDAVEGDTIWGKGDTGTSRDTAATGPNSGAPAFGNTPDADNGDPNATNEPDNENASNKQDSHDCGCTTWNVEPMPVSLSLHDRPVGYNVPFGPAVNIDLNYSQRDTLQPQTFNYTNFGRKWTFSWLSYITDNRSTNGTVDLYQRGGGAETYSLTGASSAPGPYSQAFLTVSTTASATTFVRHLKNGSTETFALGFGKRYFMTAVADPQGNRVTIAYDGQMRITSLTDAAGQVTTLSYTDSDPLRVTRITDPFGRAATFTYNAAGQLASITDAIGITSQFTYDNGDFISALTTPYGTTRFTFGDLTTNASLGSTRFLNITDALGHVSRVEFRQFAPGIPFADPDGLPRGMMFGSTGDQPNSYMYNRNTFIWNPVQYAAATANGGLDYTKAKLIHWLHIRNDATLSASRVVESIKEPLEKRVWYIYPNQPDPIFVGSSDTPIQIGRILDNGSSQVRTFSYNPVGNVTSYTDPAGRKTTYAYDPSGIDLLSVTNASGGGQLLAATYNSAHRPTAITGANGATTSYAYNAGGQPTRITDALGNVSTYGYEAGGYLTSVQGPVSGNTYVFTRDGAGRISSATDPAGSRVSYTYDNADRPVSATFPDGTSARFGYNLLDLISTTDRLGQVTQLAYDAQRQLVKVVDPLGQITQYSYTQSGKLASITDPNGHSTSTTRDIQDRITSKTFADGTRQFLTYDSATTRVRTATDARGQVTTYAYNGDDSIASITYTNAPAVSFRYDPAYLRPVAMTDGIGTSTYTYGDAGSLGANRVISATTPVAGTVGVNDTIAYGYDALNRVKRRTVNGRDETTTYDALGRVTNVANALDSFTYGYGDATARVSQISSLKGPGLALTYYDGNGDELLKQMKYTAGSTTLSQFAYEYNANDNVTKLSDGFGQQLAARNVAPQVADGGGDPATRIEKASLLPISSAALATVTGQHMAATVNLIIFVLSGLGWMTFFTDRHWRALWMIPPVIAMALLASCGPQSGNAVPGGGVAPSAMTQVTAYSYDRADRLIAAATGTAGAPPSSTAPPTNSYSYDAASNVTGITEGTTQRTLSFTPTNAIDSNTYDANGSPTELSGAVYSWDGANRLLSSSISGKETNFYYDGLSRLVRIVEKMSGAVTADHAYGWCGNTRCVERDNLQSGAPVSKQYFGQGEIQGTTALYYVTDRLGSVRQLVDASGAVQAQYDYTPYGRRTKVAGSANSDIGFTGLFHNDASGLDFAVYRAYNSSNARWLNRDPIGEAGGLNLYGYVGGNPTNFIDPRGQSLVQIAEIIGLIFVGMNIFEQQVYLSTPPRLPGPNGGQRDAMPRDRYGNGTVCTSYNPRGYAIPANTPYVTNPQPTRPENSESPEAPEELDELPEAPEIPAPRLIPLYPAGR